MKKYTPEELLIWDGYVQAFIAALAAKGESVNKVLKNAMDLADEMMEKRNEKLNNK